MVDRDFGNWMAGFIDGEGCFYISRDRSRGTFRAKFSMSLRVDDRPIIDECRVRTGLGSIHEYQGQSGNRVVRWAIQSHADCAALIELLDQFPLRAKKARDFAVWRRAVVAASPSEIRLGRGQKNQELNCRMEALKAELAQVRSEGL